MNALRTVLVVTLLLVGCGSPLVGLECREGYTRCGDGCFDLRNDPTHCGSCGVSCGVREQCVENACVLRPVQDGGAEDGGMDASSDGGSNIDAGRDASMDATVDAQADGGSGDSAVVPPPICTGPGSPPDCICGLGQQRCGDFCIDPQTDRNNCGDCGIVCATSDYCAAGVCSPRCLPPLTLCSDICVDLLTNDNFCGDCTTACEPVAACLEGECVGSAVGHIVVLGHDMSAVRTPMQTLVGNSVFLVRGSPARVLVYDAATTQASRDGVLTAIDVMAKKLGRSYQLTTAMAELVPLQLNSADVFVIMVQQGSSDEVLQALGQEWSAALGTFLFRGGVVVLFDAGGNNAGTYQILTGANLLGSATTRTPIPRSLLTLITPSDAIAAGMPTQYQSEGASAVFSVDPATDHIVVVGDPNSRDIDMNILPVVLHIVRYTEPRQDPMAP